LSGNEAIALGAFEARVAVASAYPGTPSTEILERLSEYEGLYAEWAPNEKVALEVALGASFAGARALVAMKHVGLNVAADPLFTAAYTGVMGGLVIVTADDPHMHSSQNEQDNRNYASAAKVPMLEPADAREAKSLTKLAFEISEEFDTPVLLRTTTRVSHVKGAVEEGPHEHVVPPTGMVKMPQKFVMLPEYARARRIEIEGRLERLKAFADKFSHNTVHWGDRKRGFITSGGSYLYVKEAFPEAAVLKLGMVYPLAEGLVKDFASKVEELYVVEELDPFIELQVKALGINCRGKELLPSYGELGAATVRQGIEGGNGKAVHEADHIPERPPNMCPGCPHRGVFYALSQLDVFVTGDIGCYTLAALEPLGALDSCVCMGASIGNAFGMEKAIGENALGKIVAVIGDSTFIHSGITSLIEVVYNKGLTTVVILDNNATAMTGRQSNPTTGRTVTGEPTAMLDLEALCRAVGVKHVKVVNPNDIDSTMKVLKEELQRPEPSVVITRAPCVLLAEELDAENNRYVTISERCQGCGKCLSIGCPAIQWVLLTREEGVDFGLRGKRKGQSRIDTVLCRGCGQCASLCKSCAIVSE